MRRRNGQPKSLSKQAEAAFDRAAHKVILLAKQTGTPVVVWKDGRIEQISGDQVESALQADAAGSRFRQRL